MQEYLERLKSHTELPDLENIDEKILSPQSAETSIPSRSSPCIQPYKLEGAKLNDLFGLQNALPPTTSGFLLADIGIILEDAPRNPLKKGVLQRQGFSENTWGSIQMIDNREGRPLEEEEGFDIPLFPSNKYPHDLKDPHDLEGYFEMSLTRFINENIECDYLNAMSHSPAIRRNLGLPKIGLHPGDQLLSTKKHFPGIHSSYVYISSKGSAFALHVEDFYLHSANILYAGAPKLWIIIHPNSRLQLESQIPKMSKERPQCSQFIRHLNLLPRPSLLRQWGIDFQVVLQRPGYIVLLQPNAYHYGINLGANIAEAINYSDPDWNVPLLYHACLSACYLEAAPMLVSDMEIRKLRKLDIDETWECASTSESPKSKYAAKKCKSKAKSSFKQKNLTVNTHKRKNKDNRISLSSSNSSIEKSQESDTSSLTSLSDHEQSLYGEEHRGQIIRRFRSVEEEMIEPTQNISNPQETMDVINSVLELIPMNTSIPPSNSTPNVADIRSLSIPNQSNNLSEIPERHPSNFPLNDGLYLTPQSTFPLSDDYHSASPERKINFWISWWENYVERDSEMLAKIPKKLQSLTVRNDLKFFLPPLNPSNSSYDNSSSWLNDNIVYYTSQTFSSIERGTWVIDPIQTSSARSKTEKRFFSNQGISSNPDITSIFLPCHHNNHWSLVVIEPPLKKFTVYDNTKNLNPTVIFVRDSYRLLEPEQEVTWKPVSVLVFYSLNHQS